MNKTYPAHKMARRAFRPTAIGAAVLGTDSILHPEQIKTNFYIFLGFIALDIVIFIIQFSLGRYAKVSFANDGFTYSKHFKPESVSWDKVTAVEEVSRFMGEIRYYLIKADIDGAQKEFYIEKNYETRGLMESFYFKQDTGGILKLPFLKKKVTELWVDVIGLLVLAVLLSAAMQHKDMIGANAFIMIAASVLVLAAASVAIFYYAKRESLYNVEKQGVHFKIDGEKCTLSWDESEAIKYKQERLGTRDYYFLKLYLKEPFAGKYDLLEVPVSLSKLQKLAKKMEVIKEE